MPELSRRQPSPDALPRVLGIAAIALLMLCAVLLLTSCKDSRAIKEITYTQDADTVDYDNENKYRIASPLGEATEGVDTTEYDINEDAAANEKLLLNVVYTSENPETDLPVAPYLYDEQGTYDTEASVPVGTSDEQSQNDPTDSEQGNEPKSEQQDQPDNNSPQDNQAPSHETNDDTRDNEGIDGTNDDSNQQGDETEGDDPGKHESDDPGQGGEPQEEQIPGVPPTADVYDTTGDAPVIPEVGTIAATGQIAVIVQMLGGDAGTTSPLVAADSELLDGNFTGVFADEGSGNITAAWTAGNADMDALIAAKPETVLVYSDAEFTEDQKQLLGEANISITVVPRLTSATRIKVAVDTVGKMLAKATENKSSNRAADYIAYHDSLAKSVEGARGYGATGGQLYDADATVTPAMFTARKWTLVVDEWDYSASYSGSGEAKGAVSSADTGVGLASVGYLHSPVSYYLGVAGVINNGAAIDTISNHAGLLAPVWQFSTSVLDTSSISWSSNAFANRVLPIFNQAFKQTTLVTAGTAKNDVPSNGFGTEKFPVVIVGTERMKNVFQGQLAIKEKNDNIYHVFGEDKLDGYTFVGKVYKGVMIMSTISEDIDRKNSVVVNPHGLFSSWLEGSAESCLESAWAANIEQFENEWSGSASTEISNFYSTFYRYDLSNSELDDILEGLS